MSKVIRVRYEKGILKPLEPIEFREGEEIVLEVKNPPSGRGIWRFFGIIKAKDSEPVKEEDYYEHLSERGRIPRQ
ncbi:MAG: antitoxin family protein [Desulfurococcales archaeon]|nr:antitoxin family protein [Desulfurococcales archaeon]